MRHFTRLTATIVAVLAGSGLLACSKDKATEGSPATASSAKAQASASAPETYKLGDTVTFPNDSQWTVLLAEDRGQVLPGKKFLDPRKTAGRFIMVKYKVRNDGKSTSSVKAPTLVDDKGRKVQKSTDGFDWVPEPESYADYDLGAGAEKTFWAIYEVPADSTQLKLHIWPFRIASGNAAFVEVRAVASAVASAPTVVPPKKDTSACSEKCQDDWASCSAVNLGNDVALEGCNKKLSACQLACAQ